MQPIFFNTIYLLSNLFSIYIFYKFMRIFFSKCKTPRFFECLSYCVFFLINSWLHLAYGLPFLNLLLTFLFLILIAFLYEYSIKKSFLSATIILLTLGCIDISIAIFVSSQNLTLFSTFEYESIFALVAVRVLSYIFVIVLQKFRTNRTEGSLPHSYWFSLCLVPVATIFMLLAILSGTYVADILIFITVLSVFTINVLVFFLYDRITTLMTERMEQKLMEEQSKYHEQQIQTMKLALDSYKVIRHDIGNKVTPLRHLIEKGDIKKLTAKIEELAEICSAEKRDISTGNDSIDSIINFKLHSAEKLNIKTNIKANIPIDLHIPLFDIAIILGNMIDNAISATTEVENRWIEVLLKYSKGCLIITVTNSYDGYIDRSKEGLITRKKDKVNHGIGLKSINAVVKKYNGEMQIEYDDKQFENKVLLYI